MRVDLFVFTKVNCLCDWIFYWSAALFGCCWNDDCLDPIVRFCFRLKRKSRSFLPTMSSTVWYVVHKSYQIYRNVIYFWTDQFALRRFWRLNIYKYTDFTSRLHRLTDINVLCIYQCPRFLCCDYGFTHEAHSVVFSKLTLLIFPIYYWYLFIGDLFIYSQFIIEFHFLLAVGYLIVDGWYTLRLEFPNALQFCCIDSVNGIKTQRFIKRRKSFEIVKLLRFYSVDRLKRSEISRATDSLTHYRLQTN